MFREGVPAGWGTDYPDHIIKQGKINIIVTGEDHTPPVIRWANVSGDNTVQVKAYDGSKIKQVIVRLKDKDDPQRTIEAVLNDDGKDGDRTEADGLFTKKIPEQKFGLFRMEIWVKDSFGNNKFEICNGLFVFH